ncbi:MAG TPA: HAD-IC family P-type ATPase, partial [Edaphobacter sp.]|nr:HAD-IC family P-type ATPase [Edaphobacter sp.]
MNEEVSRRDSLPPPGKEEDRLRRPQSGLSSQEAAQRLAKDGPNALAEPATHPVLVLLSKFWAPVPWMLEATIVLELLLRKRTEAIVIGALLLFNDLLGLVQERRATNALALLRKSLPVRARVMRDSVWNVIDAQQIVVGDVIYLRLGDIVPADAEVAEGSVSVDQSALTGESQPVDLAEGQTAHAGSTIVRGEATAQVTAAGSRTSFGKTAELVSTAKTVSHLQSIIFRIVKNLVMLDLALVVALLVFAWATGLPLREMVPFALILLVASVPAALPATFTLATAFGSMELAREGVLVTRLSAIEEAAAMDILFSDKTGTLTENRLSVKETVVYAARSLAELMRLAAYASDAGNQDPIDLAVLRFCADNGVVLSQQSRTGFTPFDPASKMSEAVISHEGAPLYAVKGYPASVASAAADEGQWKADLERLAGQGYRVIAVASGIDRRSLRLAGLIAFEDPPRGDSKQLVERLRRLGVRVVMVTGDSVETAASIARSVGIGERPGQTKQILASPRQIDNCDIFA